MFFFNDFWSEKGQLIIPSAGVSSPGITEVLEDLTPQLGGDLDVNGKSIVSVSDGDIPITPDGTGDVILDGLKFPQADGAANETLQTDGAGQLSFAAPVWVGVSFNAGDFTGSDSMTWTVEEADVNNLTYTISGKVMTVSFFINTTTVGGTPSGDLQILIPASKTSTKFMANAIFALDNNINVTGWCLVSAAGTIITCRQIASANWTASTNLTFVRGQITFEID